MRCPPPHDPWDEDEGWSRNHAEPFAPEFTVTDNPVTAVLLGPDGEPISEWRERVPFGFAVPAVEDETTGP